MSHVKTERAAGTAVHRAPSRKKPGVYTGPVSLPVTDRKSREDDLNELTDDKNRNGSENSASGRKTRKATGTESGPSTRTKSERENEKTSPRENRSAGIKAAPIRESPESSAKACHHTMPKTKSQSGTASAESGEMLRKNSAAGSPQAVNAEKKTPAAHPPEKKAPQRESDNIPLPANKPAARKLLLFIASPRKYL